jgi:hypothetical protein
MSSNRNLYEPKHDFYQACEQFSSYSELVLSYWSDRPLHLFPCVALPQASALESAANRDLWLLRHST